MKLNFHENHRLLFGVVFFGFIALTVIIAVAPAVWVQDHNRPLPGSKALTAQEQRGLDIYVAEGCLYCHTQQVRPLPLDKPYGRPSAPGDYTRIHVQDLWRMAPELLGTERTGPDLSDVAARQGSKTWNYIHLFNPRAVVKDSVMQAYPWLFTLEATPEKDAVVVPVPKAYAPPHGQVVATQKAQDLIAYLLSLKQVPIPGSTSAETLSETAARPQAGAGGGPQPQGAAQGAPLYGTHCASCHGQDGSGTPGVFPPLKGDPVVTAKDPSRHIEVVLFGLEHKVINGTAYAAEMPALKDTLSDIQIAAVINHERTSWGNNAPTVTPEDVAKIRKRGQPEDHE